MRSETFLFFLPSKLHFLFQCTTKCGLKMFSFDTNLLNFVIASLAVLFCIISVGHFYIDLFFIGAQYIYIHFSSLVICLLCIKGIAFPHVITKTSSWKKLYYIYIYHISRVAAGPWKPWSHQTRWPWKPWKTSIIYNIYFSVENLENLEMRVYQNVINHPFLCLRIFWYLNLF